MEEVGYYHKEKTFKKRKKGATQRITESVQMNRQWINKYIII